MDEDSGTKQTGRGDLGALKALMALSFALALTAAAGIVAIEVAPHGFAALTQGDTVAATAAAAVSPPAPVVPDLYWRRVGVSVQGRPILMASFGSGGRRVLVIGGIHGSEFGSGVAEEFAAWLRMNPSAVPAGTRVDIVACANPDGRAANKKGNAHAVNLNGNFPTSNWKPQQYLTTTAGPRAGSEPETQAIMRLLKTGYSRVVSIHSQGGFIDYDGSDGRALARRVAAASGLPVKKLGPAPAYAGSLGTYVPERFGIPMLTLELAARGMTPDVLDGLVAAVR